MPAHPVRRLAAYAAPHRARAWRASTYSVLNKFFDVLPELLIGVAVDVVVNQKQSFLAGLGIVEPMTQLWLLTALAFGGLAAKAGLWQWATAAVLCMAAAGAPLLRRQHLLRALRRQPAQPRSHHPSEAA